jgi:RNA polymerase sigma-70 factor (ECF subfamily)
MFIPSGIKSGGAESELAAAESESVSANEQQAHFDRLVMPHLDAAFNLARWLTGNDHDAEDVAQEACMRAFRFVENCRATDGRPWLLAIVRNTAFSWLKRNRSTALVPLDDDEHAEIADQNGAASAVYAVDTGALRTALQTLPVEFREALVLRELEGLSYKEISDVTEVAIGTVMSRLARARRQLQVALKDKGNQKGKHELP